VAVGGGGTAEIRVNGSFSEQADLSGSNPKPDGSGWEASFSRLSSLYFDNGQELDYTVYAVCVDGAPATG
jgi:hypothetical protein